MATCAILSTPLARALSPRGKGLPYRLNGLRILLLSLALLVAAHVAGAISLTAAYEQYYSFLVAAFLVGMAASTALLVKGMQVPAEKMVVSEAFFC